MIWLLGIIFFLVLFTCWVLFSTLVIQVDTRVKQADIRLGYIANASIWYDTEWRMGIRVLFLRRMFNLSGLKKSPAKRKPARRKKKTGKKRNTAQFMKKMIRVFRTFRITKYELAVDTDDYALNARLYPLTLLPYAYGHVRVNFNNENYLAFTIRNRPWKIVYAFLK